MANSRRGPAALAVLVAALCAACSGGAAPRAATSPAPARQGASPASATPTSPPAVAASPGSTASPSPPAGPSPAPGGFIASTAAVTADQLGATWRPGCPVGPAQLSTLTLSYWGFDNQPHLGTLVVNTAVVVPVEAAFRQLFSERFPIRRMVPVSAYAGSDAASAAADNTAGFNCRNAIAAGPPHWSEHAYGLAIDVNTVENPYLEGGQVLPPNGAPYVNRSDVRPGMAVPGGQLVAAFSSIGWGWGGNWAATPDYQHFSSTGH
jgi:hypothetical protein